MDTRVGKVRLNDSIGFLLSTGALRFFGAPGFLKGSIPCAFIQGWQRKPGPGSAALVY